MKKSHEKITTRDALGQKIEQWKREGKKIGFTSGSFDILHAGHCSYLEKTKEACDILIVGVNSDSSVQQYKGVGRPIVPEQQRLHLIAALECVDWVFLFDERRNRTNLEMLKPTYYIKAGDYKPEELTSSDVVEKYGGKVLLLPIEEDLSTTKIVEKILKIYGKEMETKKETRKQNKAILIDRDGTINEEREYLHEPERFKLLPHAGEGLRKFQELGYKIIVVTIQAGIGLGYFTKEDFFKVNRNMFKQLKPYGVIIDKIYFATHAKTKSEKNPKIELLERAQEEEDLNLKESVVIGDKTRDLAAGEGFGCQKIAMKTGHGCKDEEYPVTPDFIAADLLEAAQWLEKQQK